MVIQLLLLSVLVDGEAIADELNPLTISHTAKTISGAAIMIAKTSSDVGKRPNIRKGAVANHNTPPTRRARMFFDRKM